MHVLQRRMDGAGNIALELGELILIYLQGGELEINSPPIQQSDWSECYNDGTSSPQTHDPV